MAWRFALCLFGGEIERVARDVAKKCCSEKLLGFS